MKYVLMLLVLISCSLFKKGEPSLSDTAQDAPAWVYSPYEICIETRELCATGEGKNFSQSDSEAKVNLASIFEVKVKSEFNANSHSFGVYSWQGQVKEEVNKSIHESVDQVLEAVQIKNRFKKSGLFHSLASLDKEKASGLLGNRLDKLDQELTVLWEKKQRTNLRRLVKLFLEREKISERYSIVALHSKPTPVTWQQITAWKESRPKAEPINLKAGRVPDWMKEKITELLTEAGFKVVSGDAHRALSLQIDSIKEFLNVSGFEKYTFTLNLTSSVGGEKLKTITTSETVNGRSQADALLKVKNYFNEYIEQHLSDLHLD